MAVMQQQQQQQQHRRASNAAANCFHSHSSSRPTAAAWGRHRHRHRQRLAVSARLVPQSKVVYIPNFLEQQDFSAVQQAAKQLSPKLRKELNCIAVNRTGCYVPSSSVIQQVFSSNALAQQLQQRLKTPFPIFLADFPIELRQYPRGAEMPWHTDEQMYASPQWELIYTISNSSDSRTEWRDSRGEAHSCWTEPNSLLAVEAEGWEHRVLPVRRGSRLILKMAFTSTSVKLPAFDTNLQREAYAAH